MNPYGRELGVSMRCVVGNNLPESRHVTNQKPDKTDSISSDGFTRNKDFCGKEKSKFINMGSLMGSKLLSSIAVNNYTRHKENSVPMALQGWKSFLPHNNQDQNCINNMNDINNHKCSFSISGHWNSSSDKFPREQVTFHKCLKNSMIDLIPAVMTQSIKEQNSTPQNTCGSPFYKKMNCHRKKNNRYQRYGWNPKPSPVQVGSNVSQTSKLLEKKQTSNDHKNNSEKLEKKPRSPVSDKSENEGQTTPLCLSNLSLCESIALERAKKTELLNCQTNSQNSESEKEIDWFSYGQEKSEKERELPPVVRQESCPFSDVDSIFGDEDDSCISQEVLDLFTSDDVSTKSKPSTYGNVCVSDKIADTDSSKVNIDINCTPAKTQYPKEKHAIQVPKESTPCNQNDENDSKDLSFLLFIRNSNKKCRPSAKKRQRSKARKKSSGSTKSTNSNSSQKGSPSPKEMDTCHQSGANSIAFILGFNTNEKDSSPSTGSHSFLVSFSDGEFDSTGSEDSDNDSDWSEDDFEDFNCFNYPEFSSPLNINVICSVQKANLPQECSTPSTSDSPELEAVNAAWKVNYHVDGKTKERKESSKKVHFANDESLVTGVAVVENWCRKGPWEECARDRERFKRRISEAESIICPVLQPDKRQKYYENMVLNS